MTYTAEQKRRIAEDIQDTKKALDKEMAYLEHLIKQDRVAFLIEHIIRLEAMLNE